jgi:threonine dehydrogenase-like Zn-dependent dehydrogenase
LEAKARAGGSDLHPYEVLGPYLDEGDILGHEPMGVVQEVGAEVTAIKPGDQVAALFGYTNRGRAGRARRGRVTLGAAGSRCSS